MEAVCSEADLRLHKGRMKVQLKGRYLAIVEHNGSVHAIDATCYHMGGPLLHADIEDVPGYGSCIVCPWHRYQISLSTGDSLYQNLSGKHCSKGVKQRVHKVAIRDGKVFVELEEGSEAGGNAAKIESDTYAFKPPPPSGSCSMSGSGSGGGGNAGGGMKPHSFRSGQVLRAAGSSAAGDAAKSMSGADGKAPWANGTGSMRSPAAMPSRRLALEPPAGFEWYSVLSRRRVGRSSFELCIGGELPNQQESVKAGNGSGGTTGSAGDGACGTTDGVAGSRGADATAWKGGSHLMVRLSASEDATERPYTPYKRPGSIGQFQLLVKEYDTGSGFSRQLAHLAPGGRLLLKGPLSGVAPIGADVAALGFVAGGTGVTPFLQMLYAMLTEKRTSLPEMKLLLYGNQVDDLLCMAELSRVAAKVPQLKLVASTTSAEMEAVSESPEAWTMERGRPSVEVLAKHLPTAAEGVRVFWCGPPPFNDAVRQIVGELGFSDAQVHEFS